MASKPDLEIDSIAASLTDETSKLRSSTFALAEPAPNPDLSLISIDGPTSVERGFNLALSGGMENVGTLPSTGANPGYMIGEAGNATHYLNAPTINGRAAGGSQSLSAINNTRNLSAGLHTVWVAVDLFGTFTQVSESNNWGAMPLW
jgi:hypothetical protein